MLKDGDDRRGKFEAKEHEAIFVGYSRRSYRVYIIGQHRVKESVNVTSDDIKLPNIQNRRCLREIKVQQLVRSRC